MTLGAIEYALQCQSLLRLKARLPANMDKQQASAVIIGARTQRQGTGPFIAAGLAAAGMTVSGIVGTSEASVDQARRQLADLYARFAEGLGTPDLLAARETLT